MYDIAEQVSSWLADGRAVRVAHVVQTHGFSSRDPAAALAWTGPHERVGALLPGVALELDATGLVDVTVRDDDAVAAGLSCGGTARVLVQDAAAFPAEIWQRLERREPLCVVTQVGAGTHVYGPQDVRAAAHSDIPRLFARGTSATALYEQDDHAIAVLALWPRTTLLVVGDGTIADALAGTATLLGWNAVVVNDATAAAEQAAALAQSDAIVVLSHDRAVDVPALAAALAGRARYVGALGSRGTQAARGTALTERGVGDDAIGRIHGPAGLDIDAYTPGEIAISIVAEILATRAGTSGGSISARSGAVHTDGVHAPPPRY